MSHSLVLKPETAPFDSVAVWGIPLARVDYDGAVELVQQRIADGRPGFFITANLQYAMLCDREPRLQEVNQRAAFLLADGMPMVWFSRLLGRPLPGRVTGADLIYRLCQRAAERRWPAFFLGGAPGSAEAAAAELRRRYPGLIVAGAEAPQMDDLSPEEHDALADRIRHSGAVLLFAALGQPKGELWLSEHCERLGVPACVQIGATFDFVAGKVRRAPPWMQRVGLEWAFRVVSDPRRLAPRYFHNSVFLAKAVLRDLFGRGRQGA